MSGKSMQICELSPEGLEYVLRLSQAKWGLLGIPLRILCWDYPRIILVYPLHIITAIPFNGYTSHYYHPLVIQHSHL